MFFLSPKTLTTLTSTAVSLSMLVVAGCAGIQEKTSAAFSSNDEIQQNVGYVTEFPEVNTSEIARQATNDTFKIGDTADITVYNVESLTGSYIVDRLGNISFPLIGTIKVAGTSTMALQRTLTQRYGAQYLHNPSVNVKIEAQTLGSVVVDGAVNEPGVFEVDNIIRLSEAIALAAGLGEDANGKSVYIIREIQGERKVQEVNLTEIRKLGAPDPQIIPNDVIFVQDSAGRVLFKEFLGVLPLLNTAIIYSRR